MPNATKNRIGGYSKMIDDGVIIFSIAIAFMVGVLPCLIILICNRSRFASVSPEQYQRDVVKETNKGYRLND